MDKGKLYIETRFCEVNIQLHADGSLYLPDSGLLVISDLHLEKGQAQSLAAPLPGFDTDASLAKLSAAIERIKAREVIFRRQFSYKSASGSVARDISKTAEKIGKG